MSQLIMGIDQSLTNTGIVILKNPQPIIVHATTISTNPKTGSIEHRILYIKNQIHKIITSYNIQHISIEGLAYHIISNNGRFLAGLFFNLLTMFLELRIPYQVVNPKTLKNFATNSGNASKIEMISNVSPNVIEHLERITKIKHTSKKFEDVVDAYFLALYCNKTLTKE